MVRIIAIDKEGKPVQGSEKDVDDGYWKVLQGFKKCRWKEIKVNIKKEENGTKRKKRSAIGGAVKKAGE